MDIALLTSYKSMIAIIEERDGKYLPLIANPKNPDDLITEVINVNQWFSHWVKNQPKHIERIPVDGHWYMITITQPSSQTEFDMMTKHDLALTYFQRNKIEVYLAGLEQAGAWHIHYAVCSPAHLKNTKRDLAKLLQVQIIDVSKQVRNLRDFNGLCNYVLKRNYGEDITHKKNLIERLQYYEGKGWELRI